MAESTPHPLRPAPDRRPGRPRADGRCPGCSLYTVGRLGIAAALIVLLWVVGLDCYSGLLFGLLLSMPVSYFAAAARRGSGSPRRSRRAASPAGPPRRTCAPG